MKPLQTPLCDNYLHPILRPNCYANAVARRVRIEYNDVEHDTLNLCDKCAHNIAVDARRYGYSVTNTKIGRR